VHLYKGAEGLEFQSHFIIAYYYVSLNMLAFTGASQWKNNRQFVSLLPVAKDKQQYMKVEAQKRYQLFSPQNKTTMEFCSNAHWKEHQYKTEGVCVCVCVCVCGGGGGVGVP
jgi:hypothetical protein